MSETWLRNNPALLDYVALHITQLSFETGRVFEVAASGLTSPILSNLNGERILSNFNRKWNTYGSKFQDVISIARL